MHAETYTLILPYFQYICKLFDFKFLQKKKSVLVKQGIFGQFKFAFFLRLNIYLISILYYCIFVRFIRNCRRYYIYIIRIRVSLKTSIDY